MPPEELEAFVVSSELHPRVQGGLGTHVSEMVARLCRRLRLTVLVPRGGGYRHDAGYRVVEHAVGDGGHLERWLGFCRAVAGSEELRASRPGLIHCHEWMSVLAGVSMRVRRGTPLVVSVHLPQVDGPFLAIEDLGLAAADLVIVNSDSVADEIRARRSVAGEMVVVPNGVDIAFFTPGASGSRGRYLLFVGRLVGQKGLDTLLQAFRVVVERFPDLRLVIAGAGDLELLVRRLARHLGVPDRVELVGWQGREELVPLYRAAAALVMPSHYEPFGMVALEAMACGCPLVASRTGGLAEFVEDGVDGFLCSAGDHLAFARRLADLLGDPARARAMGEAARRRAVRYDWDSIARRTYELYRGVASRPAATRDLRAPLALLLDRLPTHLRRPVGELIAPADVAGWR